MNLITFLLQTSAGQAGQQAPGSFWEQYSFLILMILIFVVMYFFMIRPQQKKQKEIVKWRESLKKGDKVVTVGGIYGTIVEVKDTFLLVEIDSNVKIRVDKSSVVKDITDAQNK
ncbi:MAG TPA: preprotein translocase subunit YajC [Candidatus Coprenecus stercoravium]|uniref:Sec translocon accessory complex subunit YajC n=1 Tax=Candidatus Coprenecus stercoravium TaxID=2840735 RepID=A0A9D2KAE6_9BACT|nr:preprotein translocase subunit YajC [Candidatus Coprenecus stercoravium]